MRVSKQPCARGGSCGRVRCSAWVTTGYPRGSYREGWKTRENAGKRGPGGKRKEEKRKNGRTERQRIVGYVASRGTRAPPHLTLGFGTAQYAKGAVGFMAAWMREEEKASENRQSKREAEEEDKLEVAPGVTVSGVSCAIYDREDSNTESTVCIIL